MLAHFVVYRPAASAVGARGLNKIVVVPAYIVALITGEESIKPNNPRVLVSP